MNVVLPDGVQVRSLLVTGSNQVLHGHTDGDGLNGRKIDNTGGGAKTFVSSTRFDIPAVPTEEVRITNESVRYYLTVDVELAGTGEAGEGVLRPARLPVIRPDPRSAYRERRRPCHP